MSVYEIRNYSVCEKDIYDINEIIQTAIESNHHTMRFFALVLFYYFMTWYLLCIGKNILKYAGINTDGGTQSFQWVCFSATISVYVSCLSLYTHGYFFHYYDNDKLNYNNLISSFAILVAYFLYDLIFGVSFLIFRSLFLFSVAWYCWLILENNIRGYIAISALTTFSSLNGYWTYLLLKKCLKRLF